MSKSTTLNNYVDTLQSNCTVIVPLSVRRLVVNENIESIKLVFKQTNDQCILTWTSKFFELYKLNANWQTQLNWGMSYINRVLEKAFNGIKPLYWCSRISTVDPDHYDITQTFRRNYLCQVCCGCLLIKTSILKL